MKDNFGFLERHPMKFESIRATFDVYTTRSDLASLGHPEHQLCTWALGC